MPSKKELILVGGGGHCKACIDVIEAEGRFKIIGIVDVKSRVGEKVLGYKIIASDEDLENLAKEYPYFLITIGQIKSAQKRIEKFSALQKTKAKLPTILSPYARLSKHASVDEGTIIMHHAVVNSNARIGKNVIINTGAIIEHDAVVEDHCHISTGAVVNGESLIGQETFVGSLSVISNNIAVSSKVVVGAGSAVVTSITKPGLYVGCPAKRQG